MITMICLDVDGTLTDGRLYYGNDNKESKAFCVKDGLGIACWLKLGRQVALISGRESRAVEQRARELGIQECHLGVEDKRNVVASLQQKYQLKKEQIACMGDDLNDLPMFLACGFCFVPANASEILKKHAHKILSREGGSGAVREMIDWLIVQENLEDKVLEFFKK
ncbi:KdsC family phosphatase [Helicobacter mustelae]|uniref:3-deoxy-D-manno-octulosonate 8-phosphate phosphatase n=1 Tax=Helicobacter mustelae (strain ATCC 43772 / CCUG 25715 / CIP 103759 / LMG 18044 / NCTC 12198 / R85-136P) TaxID=679897 RepID=D3UIT3_HELM1|nr:HAD hydrolase family protein [Helicobacter mustelae]CBG40408.1 3-deoxy-D-manno-octulosonate 8-phosphate phosphatase [Helicobacter mustelae 12198]SQH71908.1 3-deoxy-D-manno-octulosonate 8-phosphate phosphatase [Helicobacter mustelae]STP13048.1 3-deoxy-D-manno-octulosonate 8-phosphate phosphatase [Helicobacter mustelae]